MKTITVYCEAKPEHLGDLISLCKGMIEPSRAESGCIYYGFYQDMTDPNGFFFYEEWENQESIDRHNISKHFLDFQPQFQSMIVRPAVIKVQEIYLK